MKKLITIGMSLMLFGCGGVDLTKYDKTEPKITFRKLYDSKVEGYGYYRDRSGEASSRLYVTLEPTWEGNTAKLKEFNYYEDGRVLSREWTVTMQDENHFTATGGDLVGELKGETHGYVMHMDYSFNAPRESGDKITLRMDDWTYLQPDGLALNEVGLYKFGVNVGNLTYALRKLKPGEHFKKGYFPQISAKK